MLRPQPTATSPAVQGPETVPTTAEPLAPCPTARQLWERLPGTPRSRLLRTLAVLVEKGLPKGREKTDEPDMRT